MKGIEIDQQKLYWSRVLLRGLWLVVTTWVSPCIVKYSFSPEVNIRERLLPETEPSPNYMFPELLLKRVLAARGGIRCNRNSMFLQLGHGRPARWFTSVWKWPIPVAWPGRPGVSFREICLSFYPGISELPRPRIRPKKPTILEKNQAGVKRYVHLK